MAGSPPAQGPSDEDLIRAVEQRCIEAGAPAVPTREVVDVNFIDIKQQAVARRLETLLDEGQIGAISVGRGWVWYVPENEEGGGEVDFSQLDWSNIPAYEIPPEKVHEHPEYDDPTYWEQMDDDAQVISRVGLWGLILGIGMIAIGSLELPYVSLSRAQQDIALLASVVGAVLILIALAISVIASAGSNLSEKGVDDWIRGHYSSVRSRIAAGIPISISIEWKNRGD